MNGPHSSSSHLWFTLGLFVLLWSLAIVGCTRIGTPIHQAGNQKNSLEVNRQQVLRDSGVLILVQPVTLEKSQSKPATYSRIPKFAIKLTNVSDSSWQVYCPRACYPYTEMCDYPFVSNFCINVHPDSVKSQLSGAILSNAGRVAIKGDQEFTTLAARKTGGLGSSLVGDTLAIATPLILPDGTYWLTVRVVGGIILESHRFPNGIVPDKGIYTVDSTPFVIKHATP